MSASIQARVLALVGAGVFVAGGALALLSRAALLDLEEEVVADHTRMASVIAGGLAAALDDDLRLLAAAATAGRIDLDDDSVEPERAALDAIYHHSRLWSSVAFLSAEGAVIATEPAAEQEAFTLPEAKRLAAGAVQSQRPVVSGVLRYRGGRSRLLTVLPFRSPGGWRGTVAGVIDLPSRKLGDLLQRNALGQSLHVELVDAQGLGIAGEMVPADPDAHVAASAVVGGAGWTVRLIDAGVNPMAPIAAFRRRSLWLAPSLAAVAMLLGWGIARSVRRPLVGLTASAERIAQGDLEHAVDARGSAAGGDEIARLAAALERMRTSLKTSIDEIERTNQDLERRVAERTRELAGLNARLEERERLRRQLLGKVISAQEDERKRVARELHDETSQTLAALGMGVDMAMATCEPETRHRLADVRRLVDRMDTELHRLIVNLRPSVLDDLGLAAAIQWFAERHLGSAGIAVRCEVGDLDERLPPDTETALFRAVQEAIVNVSRHAQAESVLIQGSTESGQVVIEVEDDGTGFDLATAVEGPGSMRGVGLLGMRERIEILGGTLDVDSEPGRGTRVVMRVPVSVENVSHSVVSSQ